MTSQYRAMARRCVAALLVVGMGFAGSASGTLIDRGGGLIYDDKLNITWLQDADYARTSGAARGGVMHFFDAQAWVSDLSYFDSVRNVFWTDWRLPYASVSAPNGGAGPITTLPSRAQPCTGLASGEEACRDNEMAYMFFYNLDETPAPKFGTQVADGVTLKNIAGFYWSGTAFDSVFEWTYEFIAGNQSVTEKLSSNGEIAELLYRSSWPVRPGDVAAIPDPPGDVGAIPEPASLALFILGLAGVAFSRRRFTIF